jgi:phosphotransferase system enzyme I (PtsI)
VERTLRGISASPGIAIGQARLLRWELPSVPYRIVSEQDVETEIARFYAALARAKERLDLVRERTERRAGPMEAAIFDVQRHLLDDPEMLNQVQALIRHGIGVEQAFHEYMSRAREMLSKHPLADMRERVNDILDIEIRVLSLLLGLKDHDPLDINETRGAILVAHDLTPSLTVQLDRAAISGIATDAGTPTSHIAILTRSLGIPTPPRGRSTSTRPTRR